MKRYFTKRKILLYLVVFILLAFLFPKPSRYSVGGGIFGYDCSCLGLEFGTYLKLADGTPYPDKLFCIGIPYRCLTGE